MCDPYGELALDDFPKSTKYLYISINDNVTRHPLTIVYVPKCSHLYYGSETMARANVDLPLGLPFYNEPYDTDSINPHDSSIITVMNNRPQATLHFTGLSEARQRGKHENNPKKYSVFALTTTSDIKLLYFDKATISTLKRLYDPSFVPRGHLVYDSDGKYGRITSSLEMYKYLESRFFGQCDPYGICVSDEFNYFELYRACLLFNADFFKSFNLVGYCVPKLGKFSLPATENIMRYNDEYESMLRVGDMSVNPIREYIQPEIVLFKPFMFIERDYDNIYDFSFSLKTTVPIYEKLNKDLKKYIVTDPNINAGNLVDNSSWAVLNLEKWRQQQVPFLKFITTRDEFIEMQMAVLLYNIGNAGDRHNEAVNTKTGELNFFGKYNKDYATIGAEYLTGKKEYILANGTVFTELPNLLPSVDISIMSQISIIIAIQLHTDYGVLINELARRARGNNTSITNICDQLSDDLDLEYPTSNETFTEYDEYIQDSLTIIVNFKRFVITTINDYFVRELTIHEHHKFIKTVFNMMIVVYITSIAANYEHPPIKSDFMELIGLTPSGRVYKGTPITLEQGNDAYQVQKLLMLLIEKERLSYMYTDEQLSD